MTSPVQVKLLVKEGGVVSSSQLLNITQDMERKLTVSAAQALLKVLVNEKWLSKVGVSHGMVGVSHSGCVQCVSEL